MRTPWVKRDYETRVKELTKNSRKPRISLSHEEAARLEMARHIAALPRVVIVVTREASK